MKAKAGMLIAAVIVSHIGVALANDCCPGPCCPPSPIPRYDMGTAPDTGGYLIKNKGVVEPNYLKKQDQNSQEVEKQEPSSPIKNNSPDVPPLDVDRGGIDDSNKGISK